MRLGGWQRIGIVASLIWVIGAGFYQHQSDVDEAASEALSVQQRCTIAYANAAAEGKCGQVALAMQDLYMTKDLKNVVFVALLPILPVWLLAYGVSGIFRWIRAGFRPNAN
jgi:hypothetical protein